MNIGWSTGTILATMRGVGTNVRHFSSSFFWGSVALLILLVAISVAAWRITQLSTAKSSLVTKTATPAAVSHSEATIDVHAEPAPPAVAPSLQSPRTSVSVNGHAVPLPASGNGEVHKVVTNSDGATSVNIAVHSDSNSNSSTTSSFTLDVQSSTDVQSGKSP